MKIRFSVAMVLLLALTSVCSAAPGDAGTILARAWKVKEVVPVGEVSCCGSTFKIDVPVCELGEGKVMLTPRVMINSPRNGGQAYMLLDLDGFTDFVKKAKSLYGADSSGQYTKVGQTSGLLPLMNEGLLRHASFIRINQPEPMGTFGLWSQEGKLLTAFNLRFKPDPGHEGWDDVLALLDKAESEIRRYLEAQVSKEPSIQPEGLESHKLALSRK